MAKILLWRFAAGLGLAVVFGFLNGGDSPATDVPQVQIANGELRAKLYLPDAQRGFYRGTRFDWSGVISALEYKGHNYYGPWFSRVDPSVRDFQYEGKEIVASRCSGITGPVDEFRTNQSALGFDEAKVGGTFIKIGVGVLRKDREEYDAFEQYELVDPGKWTVKTRADSVEFTQDLTDPAAGYGYVYRKTVRLVPGKPEMILEHRLRNTGRRAIHGSVYNHNFLVLDQQPPSPNFSLTFPFPLQTPHALNQDLGEIRGDRFVYLKTFTDRDTIFALLSGFSDDPKDNQIRIENRRVGAGMVIRGNRPLSELHLWSIRSVLAVEPFITMAIEPGSEFDWDAIYDYYTQVI